MSTKKRIPKLLKVELCDKYFKIEFGIVKCFCCEDMEIKESTFVAGHIISELNGGPTIFYNLLPICKNCNNSIGTMNMKDFKEQFYPKSKNKMTFYGLFWNKLNIIERKMFSKMNPRFSNCLFRLFDDIDKMQISEYDDMYLQTFEQIDKDQKKCCLYCHIKLSIKKNLTIIDMAEIMYHYMHTCILMTTSEKENNLL